MSEVTMLGASKRTPENFLKLGIESLKHIKDPSADLPDAVRNSSRAQSGFLFFLEAAEGGLVAGQYHVAICYLHGIGTDKNEGKAREWLEKAVASTEDYAPAKLALGKIIADDLNSTSRDKSRALGFLIDASKKVSTPWGTEKHTVDAGEVGRLAEALLKEVQFEVTGNGGVITFPDRRDPPKEKAKLELVPKT